ncbi:MAG: hypothetical protein MI919_15625, partial [Holophagales bacterium]|nr:hypothetical protein [Holophagales bacterium]
MSAATHPRADPGALFLYLRDCYRADNRERALLDIFSPRVERRIFPEQLPAADGSGLLSLPLDASPDLAETVAL